MLCFAKTIGHIVTVLLIVVVGGEVSIGQSRKPGSTPPLKRVPLADPGPKASSAAAYSQTRKSSERGYAKPTSHAVGQATEPIVSEYQAMEPHPLPSGSNYADLIEAEGYNGAGNYGSCGSCSCGSCASCGCEAACGCEPACGCELGGCDGCCSSDCGPMGCDSYHDAAQCCGWDPYCGPLLCLDWSRFDAFVGVQAVSSPVNFAGLGTNRAARDGSGSFGFHEGFSHGRNLPWLFGGELSGQLGFRATQSNFSGGEFTDADRSQIFLTVGLFRRVDYGFQGGVVYDYLHDNWYYNADLGQVRGELSYRTAHFTEWGYRFAAGVNRSSTTATINDHINPVGTINLVAETVDQNRIFYRHYLGPVATAELSVGWTGDSETLFGGQFDIPLSSRIGLSTGFTWLSPDSSNEVINHQQEAWNCFMSLVWRPVGNRNRYDYHLPLLSTADNGSMIVTAK